MLKRIDGLLTAVAPLSPAPWILAVLTLLLASWPLAGAELSGPIEGGQHGAPFAAPVLDLGEYGYVAEEYFLTGEAHAYRLTGESTHTADGRWQTEPEDETVRYRTRILVVRPQDNAAFNGTVIVHWQNVTAGYELGTVTEGEMLRGYAWVGVSAQKVGVHGFPGEEAAGLEQWDPERYGGLEHPGDAYSYDIFTQAARVIGPERSRELDPMGGLEVKRLVAAGASQSASRLRTYINGVHAHEKVFDGYIPYIDFANPVPFQADKDGTRRRGQRTPTKIREDLGVPVLVVNTETETMAYHPARQPDSDGYRFWEVAGTAHVSLPRDQAASAPGLDSPNWLSYTPVYHAAIRHMHHWLTKAQAPPIAPLIDVDTAQGGIQRDQHGNALGGIRLPDVVVPTATHSGMGKPVEGGSRFAFLYGRAVDFSNEKLAELYPNAEVYLSRYRRALDKTVADGFVLAEESPGLDQAAVAFAKRLGGTD